MRSKKPTFKRPNGAASSGRRSDSPRSRGSPFDAQGRVLWIVVSDDEAARLYRVGLRAYDRSSHDGDDLRPGAGFAAAISAGLCGRWWCVERVGRAVYLPDAQSRRVARMLADAGEAALAPGSDRGALRITPTRSRRFVA